MVSLFTQTSTTLKRGLIFRELTSKDAAKLTGRPQRRQCFIQQAARATATKMPSLSGFQKDANNGKVALGIDVGGTGIKGALVSLETGQLLTERYRIPTPSGGLPVGVSKTVGEIAKHFDWTGPLGVGLPAAVRPCGTVLTAANIDNEWIGANAIDLFSAASGCSRVAVLNDADAAGEAEMIFGAGRGRSGLTVMCTLGTGIGTALFIDGKLVPNTELGHIMLPNGVEGEKYASDSVRKNEDLKYKQWARRVSEYLNQLEALLWPDLIIIGGGVSKKSEKWMPYLDVKTEVVPAQMLNEAGIVGAASYMLNFEEVGTH